MQNLLSILNYNQSTSIFKLNLYLFCHIFNLFQFIVSTCVCTNLLNCSHSKLLGLTVAPCSSLFNHSCCANIGKLSCKNGVTMLFSVRPIKKNEQVT